MILYTRRTLRICPRAKSEIRVRTSTRQSGDLPVKKMTHKIERRLAATMGAAHIAPHNSAAGVSSLDRDGGTYIRLSLRW